MAIPDQKQVEDQMRERREEQQLFQRFQNVATSKLESLSKTSEAGEGGFPNQSKLEFGEEEQKIISNMAGMGLKEGILASIASFVILRKGPKYIGRWVQRRHNSGNMQQQSSSYKLSDPNKLNSNNPFERAQQQQQTNNHFPRPRGLVSRSIWFVFDSMLSLLVGANVSMIYTDKTRIRQQIAELPLVPGRSLTADALCDEIFQELRKVRQEKNPAYQRLQKSKHSNPTASSFFLEGIETFSQNCQRRRYAESTIREQTGLEKNAPVHIPAPGVPRDGPLLSMDKENEEEMQDPFLVDPFDATTSWANDFPSDDFGSDGKR